MRDFKLEKSWIELLGSELKKTYMSDLRTFLVQEEKAQKTVYPQSQDILAALNLTPFDQVKVVILGQDPYHGPNQAHGLCFSVKPGVKIPPSLVNIFKELKDDLGITPPIHGCLDAWGKQGVLLLNNVLTVEDGKAGSHHLKGWEQFTDKIIELLNEKKENLVFILWGSPAQKKAQKVDSKKHFIIKSVHPSPLSSYRGFFGSKPFSQTNTYLNSKGIKPINWSPHE
jgi:uracil-DNA glycosylase